MGNKLQDYFIHHIDGDTVLSTKDASANLKKLSQAYYQKVQGVAEKKNTTKVDVGTKILKIFNGFEDKGTVPGYDHKNKLYHILHENGDADVFYHNEVK